MKKLITLIISALLLGFMGQARAEFSSEAVTGKINKERNVYIYGYNNWNGANASKVTSGSVVVLDMGTKGNGVATLTTLGIYFTLSNSATSTILGVADEDIASNTVGRICLRGVRRVLTTPSNVIVVGSLAGTSVDYGKTDLHVVQVGTQSVLGVYLGTDGNDGVWVNINPSVFYR